MHSVLETPISSRRADTLLTRDERAELIGTLAHDPLPGDLIPGTIVAALKAVLDRRKAT